MQAWGASSEHGSTFYSLHTMSVSTSLKTKKRGENEKIAGSILDADIK
jgi:hypothetical protein